MIAERKIQPENDPAPLAEALEPFALKQQVAERLAAHRGRRSSPSVKSAPSSSATPAGERTARIAAAVAERYSRSQSYRSFLAEEAQRAIRQAEAAAEVAALNAQAVAQAQYDLLDELDQYIAEPAAPTLVPAPADPSAHAITEVPSAPSTAQLNLNTTSYTAASLTVRLAEELRRPEVNVAPRAHRSHAREAADAGRDIFGDAVDPSEAFSLDEEIAFRQAPVFEPVEPTVEIPANLIEFPRQLVAPRRARPRLAEGPLREEGESEHDPHQLRIFEVESEHISSTPSIYTAAPDASAPEWTSILLGAQPRGAASVTVDAAAHASYTPFSYAANQPVEYATAGDRPAQHLERTAETRHLYSAPFQVAPFEQRAMATAVDACAVVAASMVFVAGTVLTASQFAPEGLHMTLMQAALAAMVTIVMLGFAYQYLCFTFSDATPGMRYARVGLCTFSDDNPTRAAMRMRIAALALATAPLGIGLLWSLVDEDHLGWHDRISRMYQRSY